MARDRISYVVQDDRCDPYRQIRFVGGTNADGSRWTLSHDEAIRGVEEGLWTFYAQLPAGDRLDVLVAESPTGEKFLRTELDADAPSVLLALPPCPVSRLPCRRRLSLACAEDWSGRPVALPPALAS